MAEKNEILHHHIIKRQSARCYTLLDIKCLQVHVWQVIFLLLIKQKKTRWQLDVFTVNSIIFFGISFYCHEQEVHSKSSYYVTFNYLRSHNSVRYNNLRSHNSVRSNKTVFHWTCVFQRYTVLHSKILHVQKKYVWEEKKKSLVNNFPTHKISVIAWNLVLFIKFFAVIVKFILKFQGFKLQNIIVKKIILSPWVMDEFHYYFNSIQGYQSCVYVVYYINVFLELGFDSKLINNKNFVILSTIKCVLSENQP